MSPTNMIARLIVVSAVSGVPLSAQSLRGRHQIELRTGVWSQVTDLRTEIDGAGVTSETGSVAQLLVGMKFYLPRSTYGSSLSRPRWA